MSRNRKNDNKIGVQKERVLYRPESQTEIVYFARIQALLQENKQLRIDKGMMQSEIDELKYKLNGKN